MTEQQRRDLIVEIKPTQVFQVPFLKSQLALCIIGEDTAISVASLMMAAGILDENLDSHSQAALIIKDSKDALDLCDSIKVNVLGWTTSEYDHFIFLDQIGNYLACFAALASQLSILDATKFKVSFSLLMPYLAAYEAVVIAEAESNRMRLAA